MLANLVKQIKEKHAKCERAPAAMGPFRLESRLVTRQFRPFW